MSGLLEGRIIPANLCAIYVIGREAIDLRWLNAPRSQLNEFRHYGLLMLMRL